MDKYQIIDAAVAFLHTIRHTNDTTLNEAYQVLACRANDSTYAHTHEPYSGICVAIQAEFKRRELQESEDAL